MVTSFYGSKCHLLAVRKSSRRAKKRNVSSTESHGREEESEVVFRNRILLDNRSAWRDLLQLFHFRELPYYSRFVSSRGAQNFGRPD